MTEIYHISTLKKHYKNIFFIKVSAFFFNEILHLSQDLVINVENVISFNLCFQHKLRCQIL